MCFILFTEVSLSHVCCLLLGFDACETNTIA